MIGNTGGSKEVDREISQKVLKDLKKKGVKVIKADFTNYTRPNDSIYLRNNGDIKDPSTILHEFGHKLNFDKKETRPQYFKSYKEVSNESNTSSNLEQSIKNRLSDLSKLTDEASASYHAAAKEVKYGSTKERRKAGKKGLSNAFRTYELGSAKRILKDNYNRTLGKNRNK